MKAYLINRQLPLILTVILTCTSILRAEIIVVPYEVETIQGAIEMAQDGDGILVRPGTYHENINFLGKAITIASTMILNGDSTYIDSTVIDGGNSGATVTFNYEEDENSVLMGFTITGGRQDYGGGIDCQANTSPILEDLLVTGNFAYFWGGGIYCTWNSSPTIRRVTIENNSTGMGGWHKGGGIAIVHFAHPVLMDLIFRNNRSTLGGGIYINSDSLVTLSGVVCDGNIADESGGGIYINSDTLVTLNGIVCDGNMAGAMGGGIYIVSEAITTLSESIFTANTAAENGGGIFYGGSKLNIFNSVYENNTVGYYGGAIYAVRSELNLDSCKFISNVASNHGGGIFTMEHCLVRVNSSIFQGNTADLYGGGLSISYDSHLSIFDSIIRDNRASEGGGIRSYSGSSIISNRTQFVSNASILGAGIHAKYRSNVKLINSSFVDNEADSTGGGLFCSGNRNVSKLVNSIFWNNQPQEISSTSRDVPDDFLIAYSDIMGGSENIDVFDVSYDEESNIDTDPLLFEYEGKFYLSEDSPCIDAGTDFYVLDGDTLIDYSENQYIGNAPDMGALEFDPLEVTPNEDIIPIEFAVVNTYPNPFNNSLSISFNLEATGFARLGVYNLQGREVAILNESNLSTGKCSFTWEAEGYSQGIYFVRLETQSHNIHKKVVYLK